eukprot:gene15436-biopygen11793
MQDGRDGKDGWVGRMEHGGLEESAHAAAGPLAPPCPAQWPADPDDYGHASPAHPKLSCPLCGSEGFVPGLPCRNCGFTTGQFTRLVAGMVR